MFTKGFLKTAGFWSNAGQTFKKGLNLMTESSATSKAIKPATSATRGSGVLAKRVDGSKVTSDWGLRQGVRSGAVRYGDIK